MLAAALHMTLLVKLQYGSLSKRILRTGLPKRTSITKQCLHERYYFALLFVQELQLQHAYDLHWATQLMQSCPEWCQLSVPAPASLVQLPHGNTLSAEQMSIIQSVVPFEVTPHGRVTYAKPLPNVIHRCGTAKLE